MANKRNVVRKHIEPRAGEIARSIRSFSNSEAVFSEELSSPLIDRYQNEWIGVYEGRVAAAGKTFNALKRALKAKGVPLSETIIRRIDREEKTLIL